MKLLIGSILTVLLCAPGAFSQARPDQGGHEFQVWTGGGYSSWGGITNTGVWTTGARLGWILTNPHGPGVLRGKFEFAVDVVPAFVVFQPKNIAYGASFDPVVLKWDFESDRRIVPYFEIAGGVLFTNQTVPSGISRVNFTPQGALGIHFLGRKFNWNVEVRYLHISDAGLTTLNPGVNTIQARIGVGLFTRGHHAGHRP